VGTRDAVHQVRRNEYDLLGRLTAMISPLGVSLTRAYDAAGQMVRETDALGRTTAYGHDDAGRLASVLRPGESQATRFQYDTASNRVVATVLVQRTYLFFRL
jgi:YD repeat-containing protein